MHKLWYNKEAQTWEEALPIGNGRLGAMVFSSPVNDRIQINEDTLWTGFPQKEKRKHSMADVENIRRLVVEEKYPEANQATSDTMFGVSCDAYIPYGSIYVELMSTRSEITDNVEITDYYRELDMETGIVKTTYKYSGCGITKEYFVSKADDVLVMNIKCDSVKHFHIYHSIPLENKLADSISGVKFTGRCPSNTNLEYTDDETIHFASHIDALTDQNDDSPWALSYCRGGGYLRVGGTDITLIFSLRTSFNGYDKKPVSQGREYQNACTDILNKALELGYDALKERHIALHKEMFDRVSLKIEGENYSNEPTNQRIKLAGEGRVDNGLVVLLFDYARYLTISASSENSQPMNLQGIWNDKMIPAWNCDYTININTQMNYWMTETCNLPECHMPLFSMLEDFCEKGNTFNLPGWSTWHNSDLWRFNCEATKDTLWGYWQMGGFWLLRHIWEHYIHTKDVAFLERMYPVMTGATDFLRAWMIQDKNGMWTTCPSTSPENEFVVDGKNCAVCEGSAMDLEICLDVFDKTVKAGKILGKDTRENEEILNNIKPVAIGKDGRILEWSKELTEAEPGHRHISHLYGIFPSDIWSDGAYDDAVAKTLRYRLDNGGGHTGWSNGWIANVYARLLDGEGVMGCITNMFKRSLYPNMLDAHPPFQIDGNFGICSAICEALIQSHKGKTVLIPALPKEWASGEAHGFITRTGEKISFRWKDGKAEII